MNMSTFISFFLSILFLICPSFAENNFQQENPSLEMEWGRKEGTFAFKSWKDKYAFEIILTLDQMAKLPKNIRKKFWYKENKYFFSYHSEGWKEIPYHSEPKNESLLATVRSFTDARPFTQMPLVELAHWIESKKIFFYTGAGISQAAGIPTMDQLEALFAFDPQGKWIVDALQTPEKTLKKVSFFCRLCYEKMPTQAHIALTTIALSKNLAIFTENVDLLHQKTGFQPVLATIDNIQERISPTSLKELDAIICIGLSRDEKGLLGWYKQHHPKGKIIAIDLNKPQYLGNEDIFIQADAQKLLPELQKMLNNKIQKNIETIVPKKSR